MLCAVMAGLAVSAAAATDAQVDVVSSLHVSAAAAAVNVKDTTASVVSSLHADAAAADAHTDAENVCLLRQLSDTSQPAPRNSGAVFWKSSWRQHLCRCPSCMVNSVVGMLSL